MSGASRTDPPRWQAYANPHDPGDPEPWGPAETLPSAAPSPTGPGPSGRRHTLAVLIAGGAVLAAAWVGAGFLRSDVTTPVSQPVQAVTVDGGNTALVVRYDDVPEVRITEQDRRPGSRLEHRVVDGRLEVSHDGGFRFGWGGSDRLEIVLPTSMEADTPDLTLEATTGRIDLDGDYGTVVATTGTGSIDVDGSSDSLRAEATTGSVQVEGATGELTARTSTGSIKLKVSDVRTVHATSGTGSQDLHLSGAQPDLVESSGSTGSVRIDLPDGTYRVQAESGTGSTEVTVPTDATSAHRVTAETNTGSIRIR